MKKTESVKHADLYLLIVAHISHNITFQDVVITIKCIVHTTKLEGKVWQSLNLITFDDILPSKILLGTNLLVYEIGNNRRDSNKRSTRIDSSTCVFEINLFPTKID